MKNLIIFLALVFTFAFTLPAYAAGSKEEQRQNIREMSRDTLERLSREVPISAQEIRDAVGYAVFTSADVAAILVSGSYGHGIAHDNRTGMETFMQMASAGIGLGLGAKDFNTVFVFNNANSFHDFVNTGLDLSGHMDAAAKQGDQGGAATGAADILPGVKVYQMTDTGLLAQVMLKGTKYWQDSNLNEYSPRSQTNIPGNYN